MSVGANLSCKISPNGSEAADDPRVERDAIHIESCLEAALTRISFVAKYWLATAGHQSAKPSTCAQRRPTPIWNRLSRWPIHQFQFLDPVQRRLASLLSAEQLAMTSWLPLTTNVGCLMFTRYAKRSPGCVPHSPTAAICAG